MSFQKNFLWGASSAAYQIEGGYDEDGRGMSIWDTASNTKGIMAHGETGKTASDHYHHMKEDVALMKEIGLTSYRFSISWSRVMPKGTGAVNKKGLQFYSQLVDELLAAGIEPLVTLYHWDLPQALSDQGGWKNPDIINWFGEYVKLVVETLSDRVKYWITINEPQMFVGLGYGIGVHAPFEKLSPKELIPISHRVLMAHGTAVKIIRSCARKKPMIGMSPTGNVFIPEDRTASKIEEARKKSFEFHPFAYTMGNSWWADPVFLGDYPRKAYEIYPEEMKCVKAEDLELIHQPLDFYGFNVYQGTTTRGLDENGYIEGAYQGSPRTMNRWNVSPEVLYWAPKFLYERYHTPVFITENGMAGMDWVSLDGRVHDEQRKDFLHRYLLELKKAAEEDIPILGYTCWSVMDNLEWNLGYDYRFGLIYIDYRTLKRTIKDSAYWYGDVIRANGENL